MKKIFLDKIKLLKIFFQQELLFKEIKIKKDVKQLLKDLELLIEI